MCIVKEKEINFLKSLLKKSSYDIYTYILEPLKLILKQKR